MPYLDALALQRETLEAAVTARDDRGWPGRVFLVEHDPPVITLSRRPGAASHVVATRERLASLGVELAETDRGGDVTYHGPGQLVVYPILDLNALGLRIHGYMRFLEDAVIRTLASFGVVAGRDACATGVWVGLEPHERSCGLDAAGPGLPGGGKGSSGGAKICALGVRVSRWISMHGLALNVDPDLRHFELIVPCGLHGRSVTSMRRELGERCPSMDEVKRALSRTLGSMIAQATSDRIAAEREV